MPVAEVVEEAEPDSPGDMMDSISVEFSEILGEIDGAEFSDVEALEKSRAIMDEQAESRISKLPSFLQPSARELWKVKAELLTRKSLSNLVLLKPSVATLSAGASGIASMSSEQKEWQEDPEIEVETDSSAEVVEEKIEDSYSIPTRTRGGSGRRASR